MYSVLPHEDEVIVKVDGLVHGGEHVGHKQFLQGTNSEQLNMVLPCLSCNTINYTLYVKVCIYCVSHPELYSGHVPIKLKTTQLV